MITEHDRVVLTAPVPKERLEIGDVGTSQIRPIRSREITHARELAAR